jgi:hypothetical protein
VGIIVGMITGVGRREALLGMACLVLLVASCRSGDDPAPDGGADTGLPTDAAGPHVDTMPTPCQSTPEETAAGRYRAVVYQRPGCGPDVTPACAVVPGTKAGYILCGCDGQTFFGSPPTGDVPVSSSKPYRAEGCCPGETKYGLFTCPATKDAAATD